MKKLINAAAYSFLAFALYLNFFHTDELSAAEKPLQKKVIVNNGTTTAVAVTNPEQYLSMTGDAGKNEAKETLAKDVVKAPEVK
jgi:hypothetical protein